MNKSVPKLIPNLINPPPTFNNKTIHDSLSPNSQLQFTIKRKRSLTSLYSHQTQSAQKLTTTHSPKLKNKPESLSFSMTLKDNSSLKQGMLQQKFHQLSLNPSQKKPLKLRISKFNTQTQNDLLKQHLNEFSRQLENKFETQNKIIKNSLKKIQNLVINNSKLSDTDNHKVSESQQAKEIPKISIIQQKGLQIRINKKLQQQNCSKGKKNLKFKIKQNSQYQNENYNELSIEQDRILIGNFINQKHIGNQEDQKSQKGNKKKSNLSSFNEKQDDDNVINDQQDLVQGQLQQNIDLKLIFQQIQQENKSLKEKVQQLMQQNVRLDEKISEINKQKQQQFQSNKQLKTINGFLVSENYKLSLQISFLNNKLIEFEKKQCLQKLKQTEELCYDNQQQTLKNQHHQGKQKHMQQKHSSLEMSYLANLKQQHANTNINRNSDIKQNQQTSHVLETQINQLFVKISTLQTQLSQQKNVNQVLSNKIALLKIQQSNMQNNSQHNHKNNRSLDSVVSIKINLQSQDHLENLQNKDQELKKTASFHQSLQNINPSSPSLQSIPHTSSKSKILSNNIIYFAETLQNQQQQPLSHQTLKQSPQQSQNSLSQNENQNQKDQNNLLSTIKQQDQDERKKTLCMKKLQIPAEQSRKRRKSISQQLNISLEKKDYRKSKTYNTINFYSKQKVAQLQILKQTISLKFQAFKYTYELFQSQMILWPNRKASSKDLKSILSEYPFLLQDVSITLLLAYCNVMDESDTITVDSFCNKMREFISQYPEVTQQQELILEKKIFKRWKFTGNEVLEMMAKYERENGEIGKEGFCSVLEEFKFEETEIHHLLTQSVAISPDLNRIKYRQYLENFLSKN